MAQSVAQDVAELQEELIAVRRDLHQHPELAFQEHRTAGIIASRLEALGVAVKRGVGGTGVVGLIEGRSPGPTVMIRVDIDGLPVLETAGRPYGSREQGRMHACGHDAHTAVGLALASIFARRRGEMKGRVKLVFQPAEEIVAGAQAMLKDGVMRDPPVDKVLSFHVWSTLPVGTVGVRPGVIFGSADEFAIVVKGRGGHGGLPHLSVDPIAVAGQLITTLQTILAREVPPAKGGVLGFGTVHGGSQFNIIPDTVELTGNIRAFSEDVRAQLLKRAEEVTAAVTRGLRADYEFRHLHGTPAIDNNPEVAALVARVAEGVVGAKNVVQVEPTPVGDDCAYFIREAPGCYFLVGSANETRGITAPHHSPLFDVDEGALPIATRVLAEAALQYLK